MTGTDAPGLVAVGIGQALGYHALKAGFGVLYRSIFDVVRDFLHDEALGGEDQVLAKYLKPDLLIVDDMGMKQLPKRLSRLLINRRPRCTTVTTPTSASKSSSFAASIQPISWCS